MSNNKYAVKFEKYEIVTADDIDEMTRLVNEALIFGWIPFGGMTVSEGSFYQAIALPAALEQEPQQG